MKFVHVIDKQNLGDQVCCPRLYFPWPADWEEQDVREYKDGPAIFGGGGLLHSGMDEHLKWAPRSECVLWGIGSNYHDKKELAYPSWVKDFGLIGCRDFGSPFEYVPCPSCLSPAFNRTKVDPRFEAVIYEHNLVPIDLPSAAFPRLTHRQPADRFWSTIHFLQLGQVVLTNTYHGAYWALLCRRPVVIYKPFSSRFQGLKPKVEFATEENWEKKLALAQHPDFGYLEECFAINLAFHVKVMDFVNSHKAQLP